MGTIWMLLLFFVDVDVNFQQVNRVTRFKTIHPSDDMIDPPSTYIPTSVSIYVPTYVIQWPDPKRARFMHSSSLYS